MRMDLSEVCIGCASEGAAVLLGQFVLFLSSVVLLFFTVVVCSLCVLCLCARNGMMCVMLTLVLCFFQVCWRRRGRRGMYCQKLRVDVHLKVPLFFR